MPEETQTPPPLVSPAETVTPDEPELPEEEPTEDQPTVAPSPAERKPYAPKVPPPPERPKRSFFSRTLEIPVLIVVAFVIAVVIKTFLVQAFYIPSGSMIPTLHKGDRVLVEKISFLFGEPRRGQVVVFAKDVFGNPDQSLPWWDDARNFVRDLLGLPTGKEEDYIKRIVAVGGDVIRYAKQPRQLFVNGEPVEEPYINGGRDPNSPTLTNNDCRRLDMEPAGDNGCRVPAGTIFVMGDNRGDSEDSRVIGPIDVDKVVGKAFTIIWPPSDWSGL